MRRNPASHGPTTGGCTLVAVLTAIAALLVADAWALTAAARLLIEGRA